MSIITTASGKSFDYTAPHLETLRIEDVATSLSRINRFLGHTTEPYTVAEHCQYVCELIRLRGLSPRLQLLGLLHDASEAYIGDCPGPLKHLSFMAGYRALEQWVAEAVYRDLLGFTPSEDELDLVKQAELAACDAERRDLKGRVGRPSGRWETENTPRVMPIRSDLLISRFYLRSYRELKRDLHAAQHVGA